MRRLRLFAVIAALFSTIWMGTMCSDAAAQGEGSGKSKEKKEKDAQDEAKEQAEDKSDDVEEKTKGKKDKGGKHAEDATKGNKDKYKPKHVSSEDLGEWVDGNPPGWSKGKKVGWKGAGAPPGQSKGKGGEGKMYPPDGRDWGRSEQEDFDRKLEKSKTRTKDAASKKGGLSEADEESAVISVEAAARHGVPIKTAEETVNHAIKQGMKGEDIEKMTRAMAYGTDKNIDQNSVGKFVRKEIDGGQTGDALALAIYQEIDTRQQAKAEEPQTKSPWWKRIFGG